MYRFDNTNSGGICDRAGGFFRQLLSCQLQDAETDDTYAA